MPRPWTRSMPSPPEENYCTQTSNNFTQGQSSQQGSEAAFSQVCRLYEQSQQQRQEMMNHVINMWEIIVDHISNNPNCLNYKRHVPQRSLTLIGRLRPMIGFETLKGN